MSEFSFIRLFGAVSLVFCLSLGGCASRKSKDPPFVFRSDQTLKFDGRDLAFDTWSPKTSEKHPLVVLIHGGGWEEGRDHSDMRSIGDRFAEAGYFVLNVSYRYAPASKFPSQLRDLDAFFEWAVKNSGPLAIDTSRAGLIGYSAGAHLALMMAYSSYSDASQEVKIRAVAAGGSPADLTRFPDSPLVKQLVTGGEDSTSDFYKKNLELGSPIKWVTPSSPPTFLYHGRHDWIVDVEQSRDLADKLRMNAVPVRYIETNLGHIYNFFFDESEIKSAIDFFDLHVRGKAVSR